MIETGNSNITSEEAMEILTCIAHESLSAEEVCSYFNISRATLTNYIRDGIIPKGRKVRYRTGLVWFKDELIASRLTAN